LITAFHEKTGRLLEDPEAESVFICCIIDILFYSQNLVLYGYRLSSGCFSLVSPVLTKIRVQYLDLV
jgi:hypothetical protein